MAIKTNWDVAHSFFYADRNEVCNKSWLNIHYDGDMCYSYGTVIAKIVIGLDGRKYTLLSYDNMSATTSKHIGNLYSASPYEVIRVPMQYGNSYFDVKWLERRISDNLERYSKSRLSRKENRTEYINYFTMLLDVDAKIIKISPEVIATYRPLYDVLQSSDSIKELKKNIAEAERKEREHLLQICKPYFDMYDTSQLARIAYEHAYADICGVSPVTRDALRKFINPKNELAYVWRKDDGNYRTSKGITMRKEIVHAAIKRYLTKEMKHGDMIERYVVISLTDNFVKVGCHTIPMENINDIIDTMEIAYETR